MSAKARALRTLYRRHLISLAGVQQALADGLITQAEYEWIVG
jgi:hypothetical protein